MSPLETWLVAATRGLSAESSAQVRAEIQEHYQSAHEAALANGAASQEADLMAVTALGDARSANRQYRRVLLTVREAKLLHFMTRPSSLPPGRVTLGKWLAGILVAEAIGGMFLVALKDPAWLYFSLALLGAFLISLLPIDTPSRGRTYRCAKWAAFMGGAALAAWYGVKPAWIPLACLLFPAYQEYLRMSIRRKLPGDQWPKWLYR